MTSVVKRTSINTVGEDTLSPNFKYLLYLLLLEHVLTFIAPDSFSLIILTASKPLALSSEVSVSTSIGATTILMGIATCYNCLSYLIMSATERSTKSLTNFCSLNLCKHELHCGL